MKAKEEYVDAPRETRSKDITVYAIIFLVLLVGAGIFLAVKLLHKPADIRAPAVRPRVRRSIPAAIVIVMEAGSSIRPVSTGVQALVVIAMQRIMTTLRTA